MSSSRTSGGAKVAEAACGHEVGEKVSAADLALCFHASVGKPRMWRPDGGFLLRS